MAKDYKKFISREEAFGKALIINNIFRHLMNTLKEMITATTDLSPHISNVYDYHALAPFDMAYNAITIGLLDERQDLKPDLATERKDSDIIFELRIHAESDFFGFGRPKPRKTMLLIEMTKNWLMRNRYFEINGEGYEVSEISNIRVDQIFKESRSVGGSFLLKVKGMELPYGANGKSKKLSDNRRAVLLVYEDKSQIDIDGTIYSLPSHIVKGVAFMTKTHLSGNLFFDRKGLLEYIGDKDLKKPIKDVFKHYSIIMKLINKAYGTDGKPIINYYYLDIDKKGSKVIKNS